MSGQGASNTSRIVWWNGHFAPEENVRISPLDRGFLFGDGLFETLRANDGRPLYVADHLKRLSDAARCLRLFGLGEDSTPWLFSEAPSIWHERIAALLKQNGLNRGPARVKIVVSRGIVSELGLPQPSAPTRLILAEPYTPPSEQDYARGWTLHSLRNGWTPPTASMKSLSYLFYLGARQVAADAGCDESLIYDKDGRIAETATGSLLFLSESRCVVAASPHRLKGTAETRVATLLREDGWTIEERNLSKDDLDQFDAIWMTNALVGIMPIRAVDGRPLPRLFRYRAAHYRDLFFRRGVEQPELPEYED
ncbi:aminotransferase class IV [Desulfosoma caldarium]|uniref:branched-chain-amino-acid transaminase n=1 Tax=Desulfosoma caldarium TaxID=610254 RepID=A0A3N1VKK1_9BACT|nr:aminotransferase class IV [Desulfosoma caldarium]ROR01501.1 branched-chain amino acid aminotransferase [Desulfosoma caldarium]